MSELTIKPLWCCRDYNSNGVHTWATQVGATLMCVECQPDFEALDVGRFEWPPIESEVTARTARDAIDGASRQALGAAQLICPHDCSLIVL